MLIPIDLKKGSKEREQYLKDNAKLLHPAKNVGPVNKHPGLRVPKVVRSDSQAKKESREAKEHLAAKGKSK